ncbi:MAG: hypothetical protein ACE5EW_02255 [Thermoplasmata archaeon]
MRRKALFVVMGLGFLAAGLGGFHGYGEVLQGHAFPPGIVFNAFAGPECPPAGTANCFPAMSLLPTTFLVIGIVTFAIAAITLAAMAATVGGMARGLWLLLASVGLLLVGGGFLPPALGAVGAGVAYFTAGRGEE